MNSSKQKTIDHGNVITGWDVPEFEKHERTKTWYIISSVAALLFLLFSFLTANFLFAVIIIITALVIILRDGQEPDIVKFSINDDGLVIGNKFYDYDEIKNFSVIHKPRQETKNLYFEFKSPIRQRLSIPLQKENPLQIRKYLLKYLSEDLDRTGPPLSEQLAKLFKL